MSEAIDVLRDIDQLRRDLSGYHGQLKAHNDLQRHCDNQRERITELEGLYAIVKQDRDAYKRQAEKFVVENVKLRELVKDIDEVADPYLWEFIGRRMRELGIEVDK